MIEQAERVTADHLCRDAYVYIRQATLSQQVVNWDMIQRQYALGEKAMALGWPVEQVMVTDCDLGQSGANIRDREGLQHLLAEVSKGSVGIVAMLDVSRLSRNCCDWFHVLELCAGRNTLILIGNRVYDPAHIEDQMLLGLKAMHEPELQLSQD